MRTILTNGLAAMHIPASQAAVDALAEYARQLLEANKITNLTAITDETGVAQLHLLDSAALLGVADFAGKRVLDVGTGAGFPGVPLAILQADADVTVLDSGGKKLDFGAAACDSIGIRNITTLWGRAEELEELRESFDIVTSRAVADLRMLAELCLPMVKTGGVCLAMKAIDCAEELAQATYAIRTLGGEVREIQSYTIPGTDVTHGVIVIDKLSPTPAGYPRRYAQIKKKPLMEK